jgi:hypothetical protein
MPTGDRRTEPWPGQIRLSRGAGRGDAGRQAPQMTPDDDHVTPLNRSIAYSLSLTGSAKGGGASFARPVKTMVVISGSSCEA